MTAVLRVKADVMFATMARVSLPTTGVAFAATTTDCSQIVLPAGWLVQQNVTIVWKVTGSPPLT